MEFGGTISKGEVSSSGLHFSNVMSDGKEETSEKREIRKLLYPILITKISHNDKKKNQC